MCMSHYFPEFPNAEIVMQELNYPPPAQFETRSPRPPDNNILFRKRSDESSTNVEQLEHFPIGTISSKHQQACRHTYTLDQSYAFLCVCISIVIYCSLINMVVAPHHLSGARLEGADST